MLEKVLICTRAVELKWDWHFEQPSQGLDKKAEKSEK